MKWRYLPNFITCLRIILILPICYFILQREFLLAFCLVLLAGLSDGLDGYLARHFTWQTSLGAILDPIADKLLVVCGFTVLTWIGVLPMWLLAIILAKDIVVASGALVLLYLTPQHVFSATLLSKLNTFLQILLLAIALISVQFPLLTSLIVNYLVYLVGLTTVVCLIDYIGRGVKELIRIRHKFHE